MASNYESTLIRKSEKVDQYKLFKIGIDAALKQKDLQQMLYLCRNIVSPKALATCKGFTDLATLLEEKRIMSTTNVRILDELFALVKREDLIERLAEFEGSRLQIQSHQESDFVSEFR